MIPYLAFYIILSLLSFFKEYKISFFIIFSFLLIFIGLKYEVGGDWINYLKLFNNDYKNLRSIVNIKEPFFNLIILIIAKFNYFIIILNFFSGLIFLSGLFLYISIFKNKILNLTLTFPIIILIVGLGYVKQSIGLGFIFYSLYFMHKDRDIISIIFTVIAGFFHIGAFIIIINQLIYIIVKKKIPIYHLFTLIFSLLFIFNLLINFTNNGWYYLFLHTINYLDNRTFIDYNSSGFLLRSSIICFFCVLILNKILVNNFNKTYIFYWISSFTVISLSLMGLFSSPVFADRLLYFYSFIQIFVIGNIHDFVKNQTYFVILKLLSLIFGFTILIFWLLFGFNSESWLPYNNVLFI